MKNAKRRGERIVKKKNQKTTGQQNINHYAEQVPPQPSKNSTLHCT